MQITTTYTDRFGAFFFRVSTAQVAMSSSATVVGQSLDVAAHTFLMARVSAWVRQEAGYTAACNVIDRSLIRAFETFGEYEKRNKDSFQISPLWRTFYSILSGRL